MSKPSPSRVSPDYAARFTPDTIAAEKMIDCRHYDACLMIAAKSNWANFSCRDCAAFVPKTPEELARERLVFESLLAKIQKSKYEW